MSLAESTIHGVTFISNTSRPTIVRIFWSLVFIASFLGFCYYIYIAFMKWCITPDIVLKVSQHSMREIPFPAYTICNPVFARRSIVSFREPDESFSLIYYKLNESDCKYTHANLHWCLDPCYSLVNIACPFNNNDGEDAIKLMNESSLSAEEFIDLRDNTRNNFGSKWDDPLPPIRHFDKILTNEGFCYTSNMQNHDVIFNKVISSDFDSYKRKIYKNVIASALGDRFYEVYNDSRHWTVEKGYPTEDEATFPARAIQKNEGIAPLKLNFSDSSNYCRFKKSLVIFHLPNEVPTPFHETYSIPYGQIKEFRISADYRQTDEALRSYPPTVRDCYFEGERQLKFFKTYTKAHCYWECMTNYTLSLCGCVKFSMPRDKNTKVCGLIESNCYLDAMETWPNISKSAKFQKPCGCMPTCYDINYKITTALEVPIDKNMAKIYINWLRFKIHGYVAETKEVLLAYKLHNFIADCGGLLGLFMGCSLISIVELFYFGVAACVERRNKNKIDEFESKGQKQAWTK